MMPIRRDLHFKLDPSKVLRWHPEGAHLTQFFNTLSLFFPAGERFFIQAVRNYRDRITDPELQQAMAAFIGQEAMHGREHETYNRYVADAGMPIAEYEARVARLLKWTQNNFSNELQLSATIALEHMTALLGNALLELDGVAGADPAYRRLWRWHALEETEHKAVAFDVWRAVMGRSPREYILRSGGMMLAMLMFWPLVARFHIGFMRADRDAGNHLAGYARLLRWLYVKPGALRRLIPDWLGYFRPDFHPWQHDNSRLLAEIETLEAELKLAA
jgi:predicted metal-dependent hydrolase